MMHEPVSWVQITEGRAPQGLDPKLTLLMKKLRVMESSSAWKSMVVCVWGVSVCNKDYLNI